MAEVHEGGGIISEQPRITKLIIEKDQNINAENASNNQIFKVKGVSLLRGDSNRGGTIITSLRTYRKLDLFL